MPAMIPHASQAAAGTAPTVPLRPATRPLVERVAPHIFRIDLPVPEALEPTNSYLVRGGKHNLLIDAGLNLPQTEEAFDEALSRLDVPWKTVDVFLTHSDYDHCAGLTRIARQGMIVYSGMEDYDDRAVPVLAGEAFAEAAERVSAAHGVPYTFDRDYWAPMRDRGEDGIRVSTVEDGDTIKVGDYRFTCIATPGHDPFCICLYEPDAQILVAGDVLLRDSYSSVLLSSDTDELGQYLANLDRIRDLPCKLVLTGHGAEFGDLAARVDATKAHYARQLDNVRAVLARGITDPAEVAYATTTFPRRMPWEERQTFQRNALIGQTMSCLRYLAERGEYDRPDLIVHK